ncbi:hypothetical protein Tsubulata_004156 [Turnera subulata]|uniref:RING-type E3 ubiquitin transferase BRCA1 n=1 Tax=Turnera subulata TaxID=218843 RepID=A0A9Q0IZI0_9ROSI|nr:hypothetical protein Tsubulata_004156 [Turnera subulata]
MVDPAKQSLRSMKPWLLHLQKLGLELKCSLCLDLLKQPLLLPCDHIFCNTCTPKKTQVGSGCPLCQAKYSDRDLRPLPFVESMVTIYKNLEASSRFQSTSSDAKFPVDHSLENVVVRKCIETSGIADKVLIPGSPPSFGDVKDSENDSSCQSLQNYEAVKSAKRNFDDRKIVEKHETSASETEEGYVGESKRHKKLNYGQLDVCPSTVNHVEPIISQTENLYTSHSQMGLKTMVPYSDAKTPGPVKKTVCGFCQTSRVTEDTGPMLHYIQGNKVEESEATSPNAIHVHSLCIDWAPRVYYEGETENFLVLCPAHASVKFPCEKSKPKNHKSQGCPVPSTIVPQQSSFWDGSSGAKEWAFCGSALCSEDKRLLVEFGNMIGVPVTKFWKPNVTHVIAATDTEGACTRTLKVLMAILNGKWVITIDWIKACMQSMRPVDEEPYEVSLDNHGSRDGPKHGRLRAVENAPKLFSDFSFHFVGDFLPGYIEDLENLVVAAGGTIVEREEELGLHSHDQEAQSRSLIVYNLDPPLGGKLGDEVSIIWERASKAGDLASKVGCQVIGHTWLLESIAAYKVQPLVR